METILNRLKKILSLINDPNVNPNVLEVAKTKLKEQLEANGLTEDSLYEVKTNQYDIEFNEHFTRDFLFQLGWYVGGEILTYKSKVLAKKSFILVATEVQYADFLQLKNFYLPKFIEDRNKFFDENKFRHAWVNKNNLSIAQDLGIEWHEYTPEYQKKLIDMTALASTMKKHHFLKQLN